MVKLDSTSRVLNALQLDEKRYQERVDAGSNRDPLQSIVFGDELNSDDEECVTFHNKQYKNGVRVDNARPKSGNQGLDSGWTVVRKVMVDKRANCNESGVMVRALALRAKKRFTTQYSQLTNSEEQKFLSSMMRSLPLLLKVTCWLREIRQALFEGQRKNNPMLVLETATDVLHKLKVVTARFIWADHYEPLLIQHRQLKENYTKLTDRFNATRAEYLSEISTLRDQMRKRGDPEEGLKQGSADFTFFYDPTTSLSDVEMTYVNKVVQEKLKMIAETNPASKDGFNPGQESAMSHKSESIETKELRSALQEQILANAELQAQKHALEEMQMEGIAYGQISGQGNKAINRIMQVLESKNQELREQLRDAHKEIERLSVSGDEIRRAYEDEAQERLATQVKLDKLHARIVAGEAAKCFAEGKLVVAERDAQKITEDRDTLHEQVGRLRKALDVVRHATRKTGIRPELSVDDSGSNLGDEIVPDSENEVAPGVEDPSELSLSGRSISTPSPARPTFVRQKTRKQGLMASDDPELIDSVIVAEARSHKLLHEKGALTEENEQLRRKCVQLQQVMDSMKRTQAVRCAEEVQEQTAHIRDITEVLSMVGGNVGPLGEMGKSSNLQMSEFQTKADRLLATLKLNSTEDSVSGAVEVLQELDELRRESREQEYNTLMTEVTDIISGWTSAAQNGCLPTELQQSTQKLLKRAMSHCHHLTQQLQLAQSENLILTEAIDDMQTEARAIAAEFKASVAVQKDVKIRDNAEKLEQISYTNIVEQAHARAKNEGTAGILDRLIKKITSERSMKKRQEYIRQSVAKLLPAIRLDPELRTQTWPETPAAFGVQVGTSSGSSLGFDRQISDLAVPAPELPAIQVMVRKGETHHTRTEKPKGHQGVIKRGSLTQTAHAADRRMFSPDRAIDLPGITNVARPDTPTRSSIDGASPMPPHRPSIGSATPRTGRRFTHCS